MTHAATVVGRFAPSPSGRLHLGNIFTALISWLSVRAAGGRWIVRIEDLDTGRSRPEHVRAIFDDLQWLGLDYDEGGPDDRGPSAPYAQSRRHHLYKAALQRLEQTGMTYPCSCTRADIMAVAAPHQSDGRIVYPGTCRPAVMPCHDRRDTADRTIRLCVPDADIEVRDRVYGPTVANLARDCGDFVLRRADRQWAYQLAVVVDDALMGVNEVVRGSDLLLSAAQQTYLYRLLDWPVPAFAHVPLLCNRDGRRLSKRDQDLDMAALRRIHTPATLTGYLAHLAGLIPDSTPITPQDLIPHFAWSKIPATPAIIVQGLYI